MERIFFLSGAISAFLGVTLGAFAAHGLKTRLSTEMFNIFEVGVQLPHVSRPRAFSRSLGLWSLAGLIDKHERLAFYHRYGYFLRQSLHFEFNRCALAGRNYPSRRCCFPCRLGLFGLGNSEELKCPQPIP